ncbi:MAG: GNAT family N-acetyltransferase [Demequinaceae bacterium]|nr:GNAT family N-acetyltransferase [Demequinaceae bacterium]
MTLPHGYRPIDLNVERSAEFLAVDAWAFALPDSEVAAANIADSIDWSRSRGIEAPLSGGPEHESPEHGELAAVHSSYPYDMRVPGGTVPTSGLTWVGVHPAHRRRGLLTSMIDDHFSRSRTRGESVSALFAAETSIYQQFGYGLACPTYRLTLPRGARFRAVSSSDDLRIRLEDADLTRHGAAVRAVLARDARPGAMAHVRDAMLANLFFDPEPLRNGEERRRIAIVEDAEGPAAFALFQRKLTWTDSGPGGTGASQHGWAAATAAAERRLWSVLSDLDLMSSMTVSSVALDSPVVHLLKDVRGAMALMRDQVWVRILDVPAALTARTYLKDVDLTIDVEDSRIPENSRSWQVTVANGVATVERAERDAAIDVRMSIQELSVAYLGGTTFDALATAGLVEEVRPGAVADLSDAFRSRLAPRGSLHF